MLRFVLVDYLHLVYKTMVMSPMSAMLVNAYGEQEKVDTVIPKATSSDVWRFSSTGKHPTGVFLEGGAPLRKLYFKKVAEFKEHYEAQKAGIPYAPEPDVADKTGYKAGRTGLNKSQSTGVNLTITKFLQGGISCYQAVGYEADDLIYTAHKQLREQFPDAQIDIITGDMDMLPFVDEKTTVYMRGNRTWANPLCNQGYCTCNPETCEAYMYDTCKIRREYKSYFQVTHENWDEFISYRSAFKGYDIPYNSVYLYKMLKGDTSDNVPMVEKGWGPKKWNTIIAKMREDGVDFAKVFRYDTDWDIMQSVLLKYFPEETVAFMKLNAIGIKPRSCMAELINAMPLINTGGEKLDIQSTYTALTTGQTFTPTSEAEAQRAQILLDTLKNGFDPVTPVRLAVPKQPVLGYFQTALNELRINLPKKELPY